MKLLTCSRGAGLLSIIKKDLLNCNRIRNTVPMSKLPSRAGKPPWTRFHDSRAAL